MKKSSLFVAMFLIAALVFTVSCPNNFAVNIVGDKNIEQEVTVDTESTFTFDIEVSNGAFLESAKDKAITVNVPADFDASAEEKAVVSASITTLGEKDATTGKITKATVTVLFTAKKATSEAKELTFEIPASDNPAILEGVKDKVTISGKKVLVTAKDAETPKQDIDAPEASKTDAFAFIQNVDLSDDVNVTYTLKDGANWKAGTHALSFSPSLPIGITSTASVSADNNKVLTVTLSGRPTATSEEASYVFNIDSTLIETDATHKIPEGGFRGIIKIAVAAPANAIAKVAGNWYLFFPAHTDLPSCELTGAKVKSGITAGTPVSYSPSIEGINAKIKTAVADSSEIIVTFESTADDLSSVEIEEETARFLDLTQFVEAASEAYQIPDQLLCEFHIQYRPN